MEPGPFYLPRCRHQQAQRRGKTILKDKDVLDPPRFREKDVMRAIRWRIELHMQWEVDRRLGMFLVDQQT